jgi:hypothetical protein
MNGPEVLYIFRGELQHAVGRRGKPPTPRPMDASPWVAMSALLKAIRRGREDLALSAAATLLRDAPEKVWRRIGCVAFEDVGVASLDAVGLATVALGGKQARAALGGEWAVTSHVVSELCRVPKCRAADDLLMACELHPAYAEARAELPHLTTRNLVAVATGRGSVPERALALWYALGTDRRRSALRSRRGEPRLVFDQLCEAGWPHSIVEVAREGFRRTGEMLCPLVALLSCEHRRRPGSRATTSRLRSWSATCRAGRSTSTRGRVAPRSLVFSTPMRPPRGGFATVSGQPAGWRSSATSSSASKAGSSPIACDGRSRTNSAANATSSARVPTARTLPKSST